MNARREQDAMARGHKTARRGAVSSAARTQAATEAAAAQRAKDAQVREARAEKIRQKNRQKVATPEVEEETEAQLEATAGLEKILRDASRARDRVPPTPFDAKPPPQQVTEASSCRLIDLELLNEQVTRILPCPVCSSCALSCRAEDENRSGLGGALRFWCSDCECVTHELQLGKQLPRKQGAGGRGTYESNVRLVLGAAQCGAGETQMAQLLATLDVPVVRGTTWSHAEDLVTAGVMEAAEASRAAAREAEKLAAFERGALVDANGRVPIKVEYDMCWAKRSSGKAYNSLEGSGTALGTATGKVLVSNVMKKACDLCNKGTCDGGARCNI